MSPADQPFLFLERGEKTSQLSLSSFGKGPALLAAQRLAAILHAEFGYRLDIQSLEVDSRIQPLKGAVVAASAPWTGTMLGLWRQTDTAFLPDGRIRELAETVYGDQGFIVKRVQSGDRERLILAANTPLGLKNALLTLADRLYRDANGNVVVDSMDGLHRPAFECRHLKTDAMNCGPFRSGFEYWDPASPAGIDEFADWLASFRLTDYQLLAFVRGWGITYASERFPGLVAPQHPNPKLNYYPQLIDRVHQWGIRVWAADVYLMSGYSMEVGTCPEMLSPCADANRLKPFVPGRGSFPEILYDPEARVCPAKPAAEKYYADVVRDILQRNPTLDGLDFHIGHAFPHKICRCPKCRDLSGNREGVYRCFAKVHESAVQAKPDIRLRAAVKMFGDATRYLAERHLQFPRLEFFCWLRWLGNLVIERTDAPVTTGHEDGGGGLEMNHDPRKTLAMIRDYWRDYEPWVWTYVQKARAGGLSSFSWEPALHREIENQLFLYSQLTWEPDLSWGEFARRWVIRSERALDQKLIEAYRLALEINAAVTAWGLLELDKCGVAQRVIQASSRLETQPVREKIAALRDAWAGLGIREIPEATHRYDLRRSLGMALARMESGKVLGQEH